MAFTEAERVQIRRWLGFSPIYRLTDPLIESSITAVQSISDGGSQPDNSTELAIRGYLARLATIETKIQALDDVLHGYKVANEITADALRAIAMFERQGRKNVGFLADALYTAPRRDVFSAPSTSDAGGRRM